MLCSQRCKSIQGEAQLAKLQVERMEETDVLDFVSGRYM